MMLRSEAMEWEAGQDCCVGLAHVAYPASERLVCLDKGMVNVAGGMNGDSVLMSGTGIWTVDRSSERCRLAERGW